MAITVLCGISGGFTAILFLRKAHHRTEYIYSGIAAGLINAVVFAMVALLKGSGFNTVLSDGMWAMINGTASAIIAIGALPVLESMFRVATATRLLEILNPNQPLLKKLSLETPGTYHHSIIAANLSEAAAEALHLNTLLVKASAYYHDIGKLKKPEMYKENQQGRENPHEHMDPKKSAVILREHVIFGKYLAVKHKLPKDMGDMIEQHHGTMVMQYFYSKAKEVFPDIKTDDYRYKGPKPQTKEALILMLADCTEAAVRASGSSQKEKIREIIEKLIKERGEDKQFDECDITQKDLAAIKDAFINVYQGMYHERIQYPEVISDAENHTGL
jgi:putative nucleotidyltransferase with HDIG domain